VEEIEKDKKKYDDDKAKKEAKIRQAQEQKNEEIDEDSTLPLIDDAVPSVPSTPLTGAARFNGDGGIVDGDVAIDTDTAIVDPEDVQGDETAVEAAMEVDA